MSCQYLNEQGAHLGFIEYEASGGKTIPNKIRKLLVVVDTLLASNADCERKFNTMNNTITEYRSKLTAKNAPNLLFVSSLQPPCMQWDPMAHVKTWLDKGRRGAHKSSTTRRHSEEHNYFQPLWKIF